MKKKILNIVLALTVVTAGFAGFSFDAKADTIDVSWETKYEGDKFDDSDFEKKYGEVATSAKQAMPGDTLSYAVTYTNDTDKPATFYMNAGVLASLEKGSKVTGGAYSYTITNNGSEIFNSNTVGGDNEDIVGLAQVDQGESSYFNLGSIKAHESGVVVVSIVLDGNTQDNDYMEKIAKLDIKFGAEPTTTDNGGEKIVEKKTESVVKRVVKVLDNGAEIVIIEDDDVPLSNPRTGDSIVPILLCCIALLIGLMLIIWYFMMTKSDRREEA